jgi:hypothetical protein
MKKLFCVAIVVVFIFAASTVSAFQHTGQIISIEIWEGSGNVFLEVDSGSQIYKKKLKITGSDFKFQNQSLALALTASTTGQDVRLNIQDGVINGIYLLD